MSKAAFRVWQPAPARKWSDNPLGLSFLKYLPGYRQLSDRLRQRYDQFGSDPFLRFAPPGHFYSPLPDLDFVQRHRTRLFDRSALVVPGIEINTDGQLELIRKFADYYDQLPFKEEKTGGLRYYFNNPYFSYGDAVVLYSMLRHLRPRRVIEVGSGFSSAVMLDTNDLFLAKQVAMTFVEPYPERLFSLLSDDDKRRHHIVTDIVQNVPIEDFSKLEARDILFIDSSHVAKIGSDVVHLLTYVLPRLKAGVVVHFHDIFWPFEYPESWVRDGRAWNENYLLRAFLQFNAAFKVLFFNAYLATHHEESLAKHLPLFGRNSGGSLWIEKTAS